MKKILYFILLIAELFVGTMLMLSLWNSSLYIPIAIAVAAVLGLLSWQLVRYFKANDLKLKKNILINIALVMFIPIAVFLITFVIVAITFVIAFAN